ncbi:metallophosphoesterase [Paenibacillus psychroresistens]|uniref:Metallophosphoesterase n=2 Tax=Paenibacillus psychroresistens TaxID=1778678 RepID=A0A6B8RS18_9BACL|nr:metallophosphoesterase [Paenibacillus psychroresistens]
MEPERITRRKFMLKGMGFFAALAAFTGGYAFFGERYWIQTKQVSLSFPKLPKTFSGMRMVQFSDVHLGKHYSNHRLEKLVAEIMELKPDLICFTGDLFDTHDGDPNDSIIPLLAKLNAPLGKFAALGNHDHAKGKSRIVDILTRSGLRVLDNEQSILEKQGERIRIVGVDDMFMGKPNLNKALQEEFAPSFTLLLSHAPDYADQASHFPIDLQISGHSHGGQVRLPFIGAITTPKFGRKYIQGLHKVKDSQLLVYTNRGIGTTNLPVRLFCRPEITVFTLLREV